MKYKVGDRVRIREWDDMAEEYGVDFDEDIIVTGVETIVQDMRRFCGKETTIRRDADEDGNYMLEIDNKIWYWPECALLLVAEKGEEKR